VAAIQALTEFIGTSQASTMSEFITEVDCATAQLRAHTNCCISVSAGCELFTRFVTRTASESTEDFSTFRHKLVDKIRSFGERSLRCREKIAELAMDFIQDNTTILIHSYSRVVMMLLFRAAAMNRRFTVFVTEARPTSRGFKAVQALQEHGIPATAILDAAVGYYIEKVDLVLVGAEGVVENGGIINQVLHYNVLNLF
jgi:translation initiation factor eIF-2B subunit alpha